MNQTQNMFKTLTAVLLLTANIAFAQNADISKAEVKKNDGLWANFLDSNRGSELSEKANIPSIELFRGIEIGGKYKFSTNHSIAQNYSGIDIWEVKAGVNSRIFNYDLPVHVGISAKKQITYIQQFKSRKDSLLRLPYDPITKIPRSAQDFFRRENGQLVFKTGDFIGYRIPLVFEASASILKTLGASLPINAGYRYFINGEFDIQIFRMSNNLVRLKIIAVNDKNRSWFAGIKLFIHDPVTSLVVEKLLDDPLFEGSITNRTTDLYLGDYVLNLGSSDARNLYDSIIAQKMKIFNVDLVREYISASQFLKDRRQFNENLFADLSQFNTIAAADKNLPNNKKRIIKIINAENHTEADESSSTFNLMRLVKYTKNDNSSNGKIAVVGDQAKNKEQYYLHSIGENSKFKFFSHWKKEKRSQLNLLFKADSQSNITNVAGVHFSKSRKHYNFRQKKYLEFYEATGQHMPKAIKNVIKFPHEGKSARGIYHNFFANFELYITNNVFELNQNLSRDIIEQRVDKLFSSIKSLRNKVDQKDRHEIISSLTYIFNAGIPLNDKFKLFDQLTLKNDLFSDYGLAIFTNVINEETVPKCILVQYTFSGYEIGSGAQKYPSEESFNRINLFKYFIDQNNYLLDRSYNLRNFLEEDGTPYSLEELNLKNETLNQTH